MDYLHFVSSKLDQNQKEIAQTRYEKAKFSPAAPRDNKTSKKSIDKDSAGQIRRR